LVNLYVEEYNIKMNITELHECLSVDYVRLAQSRKNLATFCA